MQRGFLRRGPRAAGPAQYPIADSNASWVTIATANPVGILGYVLIAGTRVTSQQISSSSKGDFDLEKGTELWFPATESGSIIDVSQVDRLIWTPQTFDTSVRGWQASLEDAIDDSDGLEDTSGTISPDLTGPSGAVSWTTTLPGDVTSFEMTAVSGDKWGLSVTQDGSNLSVLAWTTGSADPGTGATALPAVFGQNGTPTTLDTTTTPAANFVFDDYQSP
jgi:hypothetical protein